MVRSRVVSAREVSIAKWNLIENVGERLTPEVERALIARWVHDDYLYVLCKKCLQKTSVELQKMSTNLPY